MNWTRLAVFVVGVGSLLLMLWAYSRKVTGSLDAKHRR